MADPEGVQVVTLEPSFETKLFHFHGEFSENQEKLINNQVKLTYRTPLCKSWSCLSMFSVSIRVYGTFSLCKSYRPQRTASLIRFSIPNLKCYVIPFVIRVSVRPPVHDLLCFRSITLPSNLA